MITFDEQTGRYRAGNGKFLSFAAVAKEIEKLSDYTRNQLTKLLNKYFSRELSKKEFGDQAERLIIDSNLISGIIAMGGVNNITPPLLKILEGFINNQLGYFGNFRKKLTLDIISRNKMLQRLRSYALSVNSVYFFIQQKLIQGLTYKTKVRRILRAKESCPECRDWASRGYVQTDKMPPIGTLICKQYCKCVMDYLVNPIQVQR